MSSYPALQIGGDLNPCYFYFHELRYCSENNLFPKTQCQNEREDFLECHSRAKQVIIVDKEEQINGGSNTIIEKK